MTADSLAFPYTVAEGAWRAASQIRLLLLDVDGVLTDGRLYLDDHGREYKAFHSRDGHGLKMLQASGLEVGIITGRTSGVVTHRMQNLGVSLVYQGVHDKRGALEEILATRDLEAAAVAFVGDDVVDLPVMTRVGLPIAVEDAHYLVKGQALWVTPHGGGQGAIRDVCEMLLAAHGRFQSAMGAYLG